MDSGMGAEKKVISTVMSNGSIKVDRLVALPRAAPRSKDKVTVVGVGRLGLCWALNLERCGYDVMGVDIFPDYVKCLNEKTLKSTEPRVMELLQASKGFAVTLDLQKGFEHSNCIYILVQTPSTGGNRHYDTSYVARVLSQANRAKLKNKHFVIGCTVMPTYCEKVAKFLIPDCENCTISYNPEFIAQGDIINGQVKPDMCLIGEGSRAAGDLLQHHAEDIAMNKPIICRLTPTEAEITKISINCFVTTKISYCNMVGDICDRTPGTDKYKVLRAVGSDSRIGNKYLRPGYGFGGPCFPRDNRALGGYAKEVGVIPMISEATDRYNVYHTDLQFKELLASGKQDFTFSDIGYKTKCTVPIILESQKVEIAVKLARAGKNVTLVDKDFLIQKAKEEYGNLFKYQVVDF